MDVQAVARAVDAHSRARTDLQDRVQRVVLRMVRSFGGWYDHAEITALTRAVVRQVEAGQRATAVVTDAYLSRVSEEILGRRMLPVGAVDPSRLREGVTHEGAYGRLADQYRYQESLGAPRSAILDAVLARAGAMVATDLQLAFTHQTARFSDVRGWDAWRRVLRPEMSKTGVCGLCIAASDQFYSRGDLLPLHSACHCSVLPVKGDDDPGRALNREDLDRLYDEAGSTKAEDLIRTKYRVEKNGEIGPVLVREGHHFRGPGDLPG